MAALHGLDSPPALPDDLAEEILLRLPPDDPACLLRASIACKPWRRIVSHPDFLRRLHALHRTPPVLGFFHSLCHRRTTRFVPATASAFSLPVPDQRDWYALDYRHGRALLCSTYTQEGQALLVWEPITGHQWLVPVPEEFKSQPRNAAVVCATDGCDHRDCHGGPFRLVFVFTVSMIAMTHVCVYSSATGSWGGLNSVVYKSVMMKPIMIKPSALVGKSLLYLHSGYTHILEYDLARQRLTVIGLPDVLSGCKGRTILMPTKDGGLGGARVKETCLYLWSREVSDNGDAGWVQSRVIELDNMLPIDALSASRTADVIGFADEANVIFLNTIAGVFAIELESERVRKVYEPLTLDWNETFIPFSTFYTPGKQVAAAGGGEGTL